VALTSEKCLDFNLSLVDSGGLETKTLIVVSRMLNNSLLTAMQSRLSRTHAVLGRAIPGRWVPRAVQGRAIAPHKTYESNFIQPDFVQFGKQHS